MAAIAIAAAVTPRLGWTSRLAHPDEHGRCQPIDPYLQWALTSDFLGYAGVAELDGGAAESTWLSFIARAHSPADLRDFLDHCDHGCRAADGRPFVSVPAVYHPAADAAPDSKPIFTGRVCRRDLGRLLRCPQLLAFELGLPVAVPDSVAAGAAPAPAPRRAEGRPRGSKPTSVIAVIDYGGPFLHPAFLNAGRSGTRFYSVWDQGIAATNPPWQRPAGFGYGREIDRRSIDDLRAPGGDELATYATLAYTLDRDDQTARRVLRDTHGAHVLSMAAGAPDPLEAVHRPGAAPARRDAAADAELVFVQIPLRTLVDSSGGSLNVHILDAVRYIVDRADPQADVVINISYGQHAGPHDGSSLLEQALDELVDSTGGRVVLVIGAGNGRATAAHAELAVTDARPELLQWYVPPKDGTETFLELWYTGPQDDDAALAIQVRAPGGSWSAPVAAGDRGALLQDDQGRPVAQLVHAAQVANGDGPMALLSLAPTAPGGPRPRALAPAGLWEIRLSSRGDAGPVAVHAWVERDDLPNTLARSEFRNHVSEACTVNGIATGRHCIAVGGIRCSDGQALPFSGIGPTRGAARPAPMAWAECQENDALYGIRGATMRAGDTLRMGGTSVAAPAAARRLYNAIAQARGNTPRQRRAVAKSPGKCPALMIAAAAIADRDGSKLR